VEKATPSGILFPNARFHVIIVKKRGTTLLKRKCKITFISHGETIHTQENRFSESEKHPPLTENGQEEVEKVCEYIKKRGIKNDKIYSSPATRCIQTVNPVSKVFKQDFEVLNVLHTRKCGTLKGKTFESVLKNHPEELQAFLSDNVEGGESLQDFNNRVNTEIQQIIEKNLGSRIIIVTYPSVIQSVVAHTLNVPPENQSRILIKTGSLTQISYFEDWSSLIYSGYVPIF
jgi:broad specificity phosphatase PhoE